MMNILFEDADIIVINKEANIPTQKDFSRTPDVQSFVNGHTKHECFLIHRLDRHVAGPMVLAKTKAAAKVLNEQIAVKRSNKSGQERDEFTKVYSAVVMNINNQSVDINQDVSLQHYQKKEKNVTLTIDEKTYDTLTTQQQLEFKHACLNYKVIQSKPLGEKEILLLRIELLTGRYHQIRSQLAFIGLPILGDPKYGTIEVLEPTQEMSAKEAESLKKIGLQAILLGFSHPRTRKAVFFETVHRDYPFNLF